MYRRIKHVLKFLWSQTLMACFYPDCVMKSPVTFWAYVLPQKILNINRSKQCSWPVHFTSWVTHPGRIHIDGANTAPGRSPGCYIQATNGIEFGANIYIAPGVKIISANHDPNNLGRHLPASPIKIGDNCWLGANAVILPGVTLGDHVIVGAGAVVTKSFPSCCTIIGVPARRLQKVNQSPHRVTGDK